jgi:CRISPR/Cas system-associated exonuclease Cas4 (RecB family)
VSAGGAANQGLAPAGMPRRLSPTAIDRYRECPKAAWFQYVAKLGGPAPENPHFALGNAVHAALERFYGLDPKVRTRELLDQCLRAVWARHRGRAFHSRDEEADYGRQGLRMLGVYWNRFDMTAVPLARERWFSVRLANGVELYCKADRVDGSLPDPEQRSRGVRGGLEVVDYKTSRLWDLAPEDLPGEAAAQTYAVAVSEAYSKRGMKVSRLSYVFLAEDSKVVPWDLEDGDLEAARESLVELTTTMLDDRDFDANPGEHCSRCRFADICTDAGRVEPGELQVPEGMPF